MARCYYFDENGCALTNTTTPDGYKVDYTGACSVYNYSTGTTTIFYNRNSTYSWESGDGQLLDVDNEDWFRMITPSGTFYYSR